MIDRAKSEELMLAKEAGYISEIEQIKGTSPEVLAVMSSLYRAGWRDCWMEEAKAQPQWTLEDSLGIKKGSADNVR